MKVKMKRIALLFLSCIFVAMLTLGIAACKGITMSVHDAEGTLVFGKDSMSVTVECGDTYALPTNVQIKGEKATLDSVQLYDVGGEECKLTYGSYQFIEVGEYRVHYVATHKDKTHEQDFTVVCEDTVLPVINVIAQTTYGYIGSTVELPKCTYSDKAGIDEDSLTFTVKDPHGENVEIKDGRFTISKLGTHVVTISVKDKNGNSAETEVKVEGLEKYVDDNRKNDVIYSFDNAKYAQLCVDVKSELAIDREIVTTGYPKIANEAAGNGVLKISSSDTYGDERDEYGVRDLLTQFNLHENLLASTGYRIIAKIAVSKDTDYVKIFRSVTNYNYSTQDKDLVAQKFGLKANTWYEWEIDPITYGYNTPFKDFVLSFRDSGNTALYIDEIYFTPKKFVDNEIQDNVLTDFDEQDYLYNVYQNVYCDPTTTRADRVGGTNFSIVTGAELPAVNGTSAMTPELAPSGSALKGVTTANNGGMTFMFPQEVAIDEISRLTFKMYLATEAKHLSTMIIGFFNGSGFDGGNNYWTYANGDSANPHFEANEWFELDFEAAHLQKYTSGNTISGFYIQFKSDGGWNTPLSHTFYIDEIYVTDKNAESEQSGKVLATFGSENALANVTQASLYRGSKISHVENIYGENGAIAVQPNVSKDGFAYYFEEPITVKEGDAILIGLARASNKVQAVSFYAVNTSQKPFKVAEYTLGGAATEKFQRFAIYCKDILASITEGTVIGIRADITISGNGSDCVLYVNDILNYDANKDTDKPVFGEYIPQTLSALEGNTVDLSLLDIPVTDESDPAAYWTAVSLEDTSGKAVALDGYTFTPMLGGEYTLTISAVDHAGNVSASNKTITFTMNYNVDKEAYYTQMTQFAETSSTALVTGMNVSLVEDEQCTDGKGVQATFINGRVNDLIIDLGGVYQFKDIEKIVIRYKITAAKNASDSWWRLFLNDNVTEGQQVVKGTGVTFSDETGRGGGTMSSFATITIDPSVANTKTGLTENDYLTKLNFGYRYIAENYSNHSVTMIIDSVRIFEKYEFNEADLAFNDEKSLNLVAEGYNTQLVDLGDGNKALQATICQWTATGQARNNLKINLGGKYKVSEIESVVISWKVVSVTPNAASGQYFVLNLNVEGTYVSSTADFYNHRVTGTGSNTFTTMTDFTTVTLTNAGAANNSLTGNTLGGTLLSEDDYLENIFFYSHGSDEERVLTLQIDYIQINLKTNN